MNTAKKPERPFISVTLLKPMCLLTYCIREEELGLFFCNDYCTFKVILYKRGTPNKLQQSPLIGNKKCSKTDLIYRTAAIIQYNGNLYMFLIGFKTWHTFHPFQLPYCHTWKSFYLSFAISMINYLLRNRKSSFTSPSRCTIITLL